MQERIQSVVCVNEALPAAAVLAVVPTYNERENIGQLLSALAGLELPVDALVVDDQSPDGTPEAAEAAAHTLPRRIYVMRRNGKHGLGVAYLDAYRWIAAHLPGYRTVVQMDADFSHDPAVLPLLVNYAAAYGVAVGSRYVQGGATPDWDHHRVWLSWAGNWYMHWVLRLFFPSYRLKDSTSGFTAWRRDVLERVIQQPIIGDGYAFQTSMKLVAFRLSYPPIELPIIFRDRRLGVSKLNRHIILEAFLVPWKLGRRFFKSSFVIHPVAPPAAPSALPKAHDNSSEMWDRYYASEGEKGLGFFARVIHWGREVYFGGLFARRVKTLGGAAASYLELGVGTGQTLERLQKATQKRCVGLEKTPRAYELGKAYARHCEVVLGDAGRMPFENKAFDVVYSLGLFEHFEPTEQRELLREQARVARRTILLEVPARTPHMRAIMWFNRVIRKRRGVWADDELFSARRFRQKYPGLAFEYFFDWHSAGMTCWFVLKSEDVEKYVA